MSLIIQPPRTIGVAITLQFAEDSRTDAELQKDVFAAVTIALSIAPNVKHVAVMPIAAPPNGVQT